MQLPEVKNGAMWKYAFIFFAGLLLITQLALLFIWRYKFLGNRINVTSEWDSVDPEQHVFSQFMAGEKEVIQEIACSKGQPHCYYVIDGASRFGSGYGRSLMVEPLYNMVLAEVGLENRNYEPLTKENSAGWGVIIGDITVDHMKVMAVQPFITGTIEMDFDQLRTAPTNATAPSFEMLQIGLNGAALNNFFDVNMPKHKITVLEPEPAVKYLAEKYFGLIENDSHRVLIKDPIGYLGMRFNRARKFDFIAVDFCYKSLEQNAQCPTSEFTQPIVARHLAQSVAVNGTLAMNVFSLATKLETNKQHDLAHYEHDLLLLYRNFFDSCYYVRIATNLILTCTKKEIPKMTQKMYKDNFANSKLPQTLGMFTSLKGTKIIQDVEAL